MTLFGIRINAQRMDLLDGLMADHEDICNQAKRTIEKKGKDLAQLIKERWSFRDVSKRH